MKYNFKKKLSKALVVSMTAALLLTGCGDKPFAEVNGEDVPKVKYESYVNFILAVQENQYGKEALKSEIANGKTMEQVIKEESKTQVAKSEAYMQYAKKNKIEVKDNEIDKAYNEMKSTYEKMYKGKKFADFLKSADVTEGEVKDILRTSLTQGKIFNKFKDSAKVSDEEVKKAYEENKEAYDTVSAKHILVDDEAKAKEISEAIKNGGKFEDYVKESKDEASKAKGGSVGEFPRHGKMVEEFAAAAFALQPGEVSDPVKSQFGYHIIQLEGKKEGFEASKKDIEEQLKKQKAEKELMKIGDDAKIKILLKDEPSDKKKDDKKEDKKDDAKKEGVKVETKSEDKKDK